MLYFNLILGVGLCHILFGYMILDLCSYISVIVQTISLCHS